MIEDYRQRYQRCKEDRNLQPCVQISADHKPKPHRKVVEQIYAVRVLSNPLDQPRKEAHRQIPEKTCSQADAKANEPSGLDGLASGEQHEHSAEKQEKYRPQVSGQQPGPAPKFVGDNAGKKQGANRVNFRSASTGDRKPPSLKGNNPADSPSEYHSATADHQNTIAPHADFRRDAKRNSAGKTRYI